MNDDFYIGWEETAPPAFGRRARWSAAVLLLLAPVVALALAAAQAPFDDATFEFGNVRDVEGVVRLSPHPLLEVPSPAGGVEHWLLASQGKQGADAEVAGFEGRRVRLRGTLIYRGSEAGPGLRTMVEVVPGTVTPAVNGTLPEAPTVSLGRHTLRGEIVDSKCWLGVMKPGRGKTHRACASLCIRGGIPPLLAVSDDEADGHDAVRQLLLLGPEGEAVNDRILHAVAEPVEITGEVFVAGDVWTLFADLDTLRSLP